MVLATVAAQAHVASVYAVDSIIVVSSRATIIKVLAGAICIWVSQWTTRACKVRVGEWMAE